MPRSVARPDARTRLLDAALDLFHVQGVAATGIDQILTAADAGKSQFYHYFASKDELVLEAMRHHGTLLRSGVIPLKLELTTWKDLDDWFGFFVAALEGSGCSRSCPIGTMAVEFTDAQVALREQAKVQFAKAREVLRRLFQSLREAGKLKRSADPASLADLCYTVIQGGLLVGKVERDSEPFRHAVTQVQAYLRTLRA